MPETQRRSDPVPLPSPQEQRIDHMLVASLMLCPLAVGINTVVGFTVAHWAVAVNRRTSNYVVTVVDLLLCAASAALAYRSRMELAEVDESLPNADRRRFMSTLGLTLACFSAIVVVAASIALFTLSPSD